MESHSFLNGDLRPPSVIPWPCDMSLELEGKEKGTHHY